MGFHERSGWKVSKAGEEPAFFMRIFMSEIKNELFLFLSKKMYDIVVCGIENHM